MEDLKRAVHRSAERLRKPREQRAELGDVVLELLGDRKPHGLEQIAKAARVKNSETLEKLLDVLAGMKIIEKHYKIGEFGERMSELSKMG